MNQLLFDRSTGALSPQAFARIQTSRRVHEIQPARLRFDGGEREALPNRSKSPAGSGSQTSLRPRESHAESSSLVRENAAFLAPAEELEKSIWAHQAGVNALSLDIENRL